MSDAPITTDPADIAAAAAAAATAATAAEAARTTGALPAPAAPTAPAPMPENGAEKFYDASTGVYNWQAHAVEAEYQRDQARGKSPEPRAVEVTDPNAAGAEGDAAAQSAAENAGLNWNDLAATIQEHGNLSDAQYAAFEKIGIPNEIVEGYIQNLSVAQDQRDQTVSMYIAEAMGADAENAGVATAELLDWAAKNIDQSEWPELNRLLAGNQWQTAVNDLLVRRSNATTVSREPGVVSAAAPDSGAGASGSVYASMDEMVADQKNDLYYNDPKYRAAVEAKAARSPSLRGGDPRRTGLGELQGGGIVVGVK